MAQTVVPLANGPVEFTKVAEAASDCLAAGLERNPRPPIEELRLSAQYPASQRWGYEVRVAPAGHQGFDRFLYGILKNTIGDVRVATYTDGVVKIEGYYSLNFPEESVRRRMNALYEVSNGFIRSLDNGSPKDDPSGIAFWTTEEQDRAQGLEIEMTTSDGSKAIMFPAGGFPAIRFERMETPPIQCLDDDGHPTHTYTCGGNPTFGVTMEIPAYANPSAVPLTLKTSGAPSSYTLDIQSYVDCVKDELSR